MTIEDVQSFAAEKTSRIASVLNLEKLSGYTAAFFAILLVITLVTGMIWDSEPDAIDLEQLLQVDPANRVT